jgi:hypothetical protein
MPHAALPELLFRRDRDEELRIREYVEWQARDETVTHCEKVATEAILGRKMDAWDVYTDKARWWVITEPTNLYRQDLFPSLDYTISFHAGVMARMMSQREAGVPAAERRLLAAAWRRWEQAAEALDHSDEAEEFQAVGMRCRECLIALAKAFASTAVMPPATEAPRAADFLGWSELIANSLASGGSAEHVRKYLKGGAKGAWQLANWLTHAQGARRPDAELAVEAIHHVLATFGAGLIRQRYAIPDRCPACGSYRIGLRYPPEAASEEEALPGCRECGWLSTTPSD